jgi:predicted lipid-binding transport protein (Tim44 family)
MKTIVAALAGVVLLASPAFAASRSTEAKERQITKQLNLEQAQQAQSASQPVAAQMQATAPSAPAAAPTTPVESAPAANPADGGDAKTNGGAPAPQ